MTHLNIHQRAVAVPKVLRRCSATLATLLVASGVAGCATAPIGDIPVAPATQGAIAIAGDETSATFWQQKGEATLVQALARRPLERRARGIILFVGDGMGVATVTASRIYSGQASGASGEESSLYFERFPHLSLMKTYNVNQQTPDSAGTMTAMISGVKTDAGLISVTAATERGDCESSQGNEIETLMQTLEARGWATGVVSTARLTHATPAATYAHAPERGWEADSDVPEQERAKGCHDIARQLIESPFGDGLEVAMGGGRRNFLPSELADPEFPDERGRRLDGRHLGEEWAARPGAAWVWNQQQLDALDLSQTTHLLGLFNASHMQYELDRRDDRGGEPSLSEMTRAALQILMRDPDGYLLVVESGRIDHAHHATNAIRAFEDTVELANAVAAADELTADEETLLLVTADHSHVMTIAGYATRGNPILDVVRQNDHSGEPTGQPKLAEDEQPYTTISYANGRGGRLLPSATTPAGGEQIYHEPITAQRRLEFTDIDTHDHGFHQESMVPLQSETHGGEDVALYAKGPWAHLFSNTEEQSYLYYVMRLAACDSCPENQGAN
ncbi:MAG: alkaline phosphatase [Pseudomonadota bacterium]